VTSGNAISTSPFPATRIGQFPFRFPSPSYFSIYCRSRPIAEHRTRYRYRKMIRRTNDEDRLARKIRSESQSPDLYKSEGKSGDTVRYRCGVRTPKNPCYLRQRGYVIVLVHLFVCLLAVLRKNFRRDLHEIFRECTQWAVEQMVKFWWRSGSRIRIRRALAEVCTVPVLLVSVLTDLLSTV